MTGKITVVGAGISGQSLALWAKKLGAQVFVTDCKAELAPQVCLAFEQAQIQYESGGHTQRALECDLMVVSSGVGPQSQAVQMAMASGVPVRGELDFLHPWMKGRSIAVTGTNGKTTTTSLIGHLLRSQGLKVGVAGNIGVPLASVAGQEFDVCVMELSSFQLYWNHSFTPDVAVLTNLAPDHLDWHGSYEAYVAAKMRIFGSPQSWNWAICQARDRSLVPFGGKVCSLGYHGDDPWIDIQDDGATWVDGVDRINLFHKDQLKLVGRHNLENAAMATAAVYALDSGLEPACGLPSFLPPAHRCQKVAVRRGVAWINDSKGTNVASTTTALSGIEGPKIVILGGKGKGEDYEPLALSVKAHAKAAVLLGMEADKIEAVLRAVGFDQVYRVQDMSEAVHQAEKLAQSGDTVLLSPACTSWDMYRSYEERGDHFAQLIHELGD